MNPSPSQVAADLLCDLTGRRHAILAGRASAAISAALRARGIQGERVLIPANVCYMVAWAVLQSGNAPCLVDVDPSTGNISPETLSQVRAESPAALVVCHIYGLGAPIASISEWARARNIFIIEDAALALGASVDGRPAGSWGDVSVLSFGEGKILDAGNGGALLCDDPELAVQVQAELNTLPLWDHRLAQLWEKWSALYWLLHQYEGANPQLADTYPKLFQVFGDITRYQLPASHWAALPSSLAALESNLRHRCEMAAMFDEYFRFAQVGTLPRPQGSVVWRYPLLVARGDRNALLEMFWENNIAATRWYPSLTCMLAVLAPSTGAQSMPGAEQLGAEIINLPVDHTADGRIVKLAAETVQAYFREGREQKSRMKR